MRMNTIKMYSLLHNINRKVTIVGINKKLFFLILSFFIYVNAKTINVSCCERDSVQAAVNSAANGDTIVIPADTCVWDTSVLISKSLSIVGSGYNETQLVPNTSKKMKMGFFQIHGVTDTTNLLRISGFFFNADSNSRKHVIRFYDQPSLKNLRIDNNKFHSSSVCIYGTVVGVIDHNIFHNNGFGVQIGASIRALADSSWNNLSSGTNDALFIEDNTFITDNNYESNSIMERIGSYNGGKLVVRNNIFDGHEFVKTGNTWLVIETHGNYNAGSGGYYEQNCYRAQSVVEIYNNTIISNRLDFWAKLRGGSNLVWGNNITSSTGSPRIWLQEEEDGNLNVWDPARLEWPAEDQIFNTFIWNNTVNGIVIDKVYVDPADSNFIKKNRDYFMHAPQKSGGQEIFTGRHGAAGSHPTDGDPFPYTGTMEFKADTCNAHYPYIHYKYPHPIRKDGNSNIIRPYNRHTLTSSAELSINILPNTILFYIILEKANIYKLDVYNIKGKKLWSYNAPFSVAGKHIVNWNLNELRNYRLGGGIYLGVLNVGGNTINKKIVLMH